MMRKRWCLGEEVNLQTTPQRSELPSADNLPGIVSDKRLLFRLFLITNLETTRKGRIH